MKRLKLSEVAGAETILNLSYLISHWYKDISFDKFVPTILMKFFQNDLLNKELVMLWYNKDEKVMRFLEQHPLYDAEAD